jgi:hypothetical protein
LSFAAKMNRHLQETTKRQDQLEERVNANSSSISRNEQNVEELGQELRRALAKMDSEKEARDDALCEELRERDIRRLNIDIHGLQEPDSSLFNNGDRIEADRRLCGELFAAMGVRVRGPDLRFCRRVGERGAMPRQVVVGLNSEEEKRVILARSRQLRGGRYDNVAVVPDLTKMQRRGEDKLSVEAGEKNMNLTAEDRERGLRWLVVGKRGEKRLIKGVEREPQRDRVTNTLGQYLPRSMTSNGGGGYNNGGGGYNGGGRYNNSGSGYNNGGGGCNSGGGGYNIGGSGSGSYNSNNNTVIENGIGNSNTRELGARPRDNQYTNRLLPPVSRNDQYMPAQHSQQQSQTRQYQQSDRIHNSNGDTSNGNNSNCNVYGRQNIFNSGVVP